MIRDRKNLFGMTYTEFMLIRTVQKGKKQNGEDFISIRKYLEPMSVVERRRRKYEQRRKYFEKKGLKIYEKLK